MSTLKTTKDALYITAVVISVLLSLTANVTIRYVTYRQLYVEEVERQKLIKIEQELKDKNDGENKPKAEDVIVTSGLNDVE